MTSRKPKIHAGFHALQPIGWIERCVHSVHPLDAKRRSDVLSWMGSPPLELREQPYASARRRRIAIRCRRRGWRQHRVRPIHDVKDQAEGSEFHRLEHYKNFSCRSQLAIGTPRPSGRLSARDVRGPGDAAHGLGGGIAVGAREVGQGDDADRALVAVEHGHRSIGHSLLTASCGCKAVAGARQRLRPSNGTIFSFDGSTRSRQRTRKESFTAT